MLPITAWLFAAATSKEIFRKGAPPQIQVDFPAANSTADINRWNAQYQQRNIGPRIIGTPISTKGGAQIQELAQSRTMDYLKYLDQKRDEDHRLVWGAACEGGHHRVGESGWRHRRGAGPHLHDQYVSADRRTRPRGPQLPPGEERLRRRGLEAEVPRDIDMRDSKTVEDIRDMRLRNGSWTLDRYRADIGEPAVDGGDQPVLVDRENLVRWHDMDAVSKATIANKLRGMALEPAAPEDGKPVSVEKPNRPRSRPHWRPSQARHHRAATRARGPGEGTVACRVAASRVETAAAGGFVPAPRRR